MGKGKSLFQQFLHRVLNDLIPNGCSDCWLVFFSPPSVSHTLFKGVYWIKKDDVDDARKLTVEDTRSNWVIN